MSDPSFERRMAPIGVAAARCLGGLAVELEVVDPENLPHCCAEAYTYLRDLVESVTGKLPE